MDRLAHKVIRMAEKGDTWALKEIGERIDGKPTQIIAGSDDEPPVKVDGRIKLVRPDSK